MTIRYSLFYRKKSFIALTTKKEGLEWQQITNGPANKPFYGGNLFVSASHFQPSLMFLNKLRNSTSGAPYWAH